jgi:cell division septation protein DedD
LTAVYVGPVLTRNEANALMAELVLEIDIQGVVVDFSIED